MNTDLFPSYVAEFNDIISDINNRLEALQSQNGMKRQETLIVIKKLLHRDAGDVIKGMRMSARVAGSVEYKTQLENYEDKLEKLKEHLERLTEEAEADDKNQLLPASKDDTVIDLTAHRSTIATQLKMRESTVILQQAERMNEDTIHSGAHVLQELGRQREFMLHSRETLESINNQLLKARGIMNDIWGKMNTTSILKGLIILSLLIACICVIYFRFFWDPHRESPQVSSPSIIPSPTPDCSYYFLSDWSTWSACTSNGVTCTQTRTKDCTCQVMPNILPPGYATQVPVRMVYCPWAQPSNYTETVSCSC